MGLEKPLGACCFGNIGSHLMIKTPLSTVIGGAFWTPGATILGSPSKNLTQLIKSIFATGKQGFFYDPNDLSTMYQNAAGTIPVTTAGQPVGLMLDKSKPITNISILDSNFLLADGWIKTNPGISVTNVDDSLRVSKGAVSPQSIYRPFSCESGKLYRLTVKYKNHTGNNVRFNIRNAGGSGVAPVLSQSIQTFTATAGEGSSFFISTSAAHSIFIDSQNAADSSIDIASIVIIKVSDSINHAYQTTSAARPILRDAPRRIDFDVVDDKLTTTLPAQLTGCTVIRSVPNVGTQVLTGQTIPATYEDNTDHCGLLVINRALTTSEIAQITKLFNKAAGV